MMNRQSAILYWAIETFGPVAANVDERAARLVEEAIEAVHAVGLPITFIQRIAERVYAKPQGAVAQEIGQVAITLEAFAEILHHRVEFEAEREWQRIQKIPKEVFAERHAAKVAAGTAFRRDESKGVG
jgi:NTP pyrophosphatase (non-canonical NTP hydrolase)